MTAMRNLYITINKFSTLNRSRLHALDYNKWVKYIESNSSYFIWYSDTESGRRLAESITNYPKTLNTDYSETSY